VVSNASGHWRDPIEGYRQFCTGEMREDDDYATIR